LELRKKVIFEWTGLDVGKVIASAFERGVDSCKGIDFPQLNYASSRFDRVTLSDPIFGLSMSNRYS
jgi:hypothetical protein